MKILLLLLFCTGVLALTLRAQRTHAFPVQTRVANGILEGNYDTKTGIQSYLGVPFAQPPVGELRWRAPQPVENWSGVRTARQFGPRPVQKFVFDDMRFRSDGVSEDCLYLNVWTPADRNTKNLPVLLYFNGGGNQAGSSDELRYDGGTLAREGVIVVTANYRLNVFGFFAHPELSKETGYGASGNWGLLDQSAAIDWVRANITAFGGNPDRITIGGESAGSIDVSMHMASPLSREKIAGAFGQSGAAISPTLPPMSPAEIEAVGTKFQEAVGDAPTLAALRQAPTRAIYETYFDGGNFNFGAVLDGHFLTETLPETFEKEEQAQVPLLVGWTSAEMAWAPAPADADAYRATVKQRYPDTWADVLVHYPAATPHQSLVDLNSDNWIVYSTWKWFDLHRHNSDQPVFRYRFDRVRPAEIGKPRDTEPIGAGHATDIEYFLGTQELSDAYAWTDADRRTSRTMVAYLANFIKTGNPNGGDLPEWPAASASDERAPVLHLDETPRLERTDDARYRYWEKQYGK